MNHILQSGEARRLWEERLLQRLLRRRNAERPLRSKMARLGRLGGLTWAVRHGKIGNTRWGRHLAGKWRGKTNRLHALEHLRRISPVGVAARRARAELRRRRAAYEAQQPCPWGPHIKSAHAVEPYTRCPGAQERP